MTTVVIPNLYDHCRRARHVPGSISVPHRGLVGEHTAWPHPAGHTTGLWAECGLGRVMPGHPGPQHPNQPLLVPLSLPAWRAAGVAVENLIPAAIRAPGLQPLRPLHKRLPFESDWQHSRLRHRPHRVHRLRGDVPDARKGDQVTDQRWRARQWKSSGAKPDRHRNFLYKSATAALLLQSKGFFA